MRRKDREVTDCSTIISMIDECDIIRLGISDGDFPYIVPVNFAYTVTGDQICFYIHGAMAGRKYELLTENPYCSFEMDVPIGLDYLYEQKDVTMRYKSVMGKCRAELLEDEEKQKAVDDIIMARYEGTRNFDYSREPLKRTAVFRLTVLELSAKTNLPDGPADL